MTEHTIKNIIDFVAFLLALWLGEYCKPFVHWLASGSLPPWVEQSAKILPGLAVAWYHLNIVRKRKKKENDQQGPDYTKLKK